MIHNDTHSIPDTEYDYTNTNTIPGIKSPYYNTAATLTWLYPDLTVLTVRAVVYFDIFEYLKTSEQGEGGRCDVCVCMCVERERDRERDEICYSVSGYTSCISLRSFIYQRS